MSDVVLRIRKPPHPPDSWYQLEMVVDDEVYEIVGHGSIDPQDCTKEGRRLSRVLQLRGVPVRRTWEEVSDE